MDPSTYLNKLRIVPFLLCAALACAQNQSAPMVIRTESRQVLVDAVVTDKSGTVHNLVAKDFHVWEDGKEQTVRNVTFVADPAAGTQASYLVLFFDNASLEISAQERARDAAIQFIEANAGPNRFTAIVNYSGDLKLSQNFTTDTDRLKRIAAQEHVGMEVEQSNVDPNGPARGNAARTRAMASAGLAGPGFAAALRLLAANVSSVPGRKNVVVFSSGFPMSSQMDAQLRTAVESCNRTDVAIYPMYLAPKGQDSTIVQPDAGRGRTGRGGAVSPTDAGVAPSNQGLNIIANGTGGFVYENPNSLLTGLLKIAKEQTEYYLLGYTPAESPEGSCHPLKVKVDRPGAIVRARASYCNVKAVDLLAGKPVEQQLEYQMTGDQPGNITASIQVPYFYPEADTVRLNVAMEIPASSIHFERIKGKSHAEWNIVGIAYLPDGSPGARFSDTLKLDFASQKELDAFHAQPLHYEKQFLIAPGNYKLKVAFNSGGENFGRLEVPLTIAPYDGKHFMLSGLALSKEMHPISDLGTAQDAELLEGRTPLIYKEVKITPAGATSFAKTDPVVVYGEVYEPLLSSATPPQVEIRMQIVNKKTQAVMTTGAIQPDIPPHPETNTLPFALKLKVDALSPGAYRVDVEAADSAGKLLLHSADFEIH